MGEPEPTKDAEQEYRDCLREANALDRRMDDLWDAMPEDARDRSRYSTSLGALLRACDRLKRAVELKAPAALLPQFLHAIIRRVGEVLQSIDYDGKSLRSGR